MGMYKSGVNVELLEDLEFGWITQIVKKGTKGTVRPTDIVCFDKTMNLVYLHGYGDVFLPDRVLKLFTEPEYPLSFQEALKAAIDGNVVEDEYGVLVCFDIDKCQFIVDSGNEKTEMKGEGVFKDKSEYKYRIYKPSAQPKFKRGDFVVWDEMYYRILNVHQLGFKFAYDLVYDQHEFDTFKSQHENIDESELTLVDIA